MLAVKPKMIMVIPKLLTGIVAMIIFKPKTITVKAERIFSLIERMAFLVLMFKVKLIGMIVLVKTLPSLIKCLLVNMEMIVH